MTLCEILKFPFEDSIVNIFHWYIFVAFILGVCSLQEPAQAWETQQL